jgi:hypothetical protein
MKKTVPFKLFGEDQEIYFDIIRLGELETLLKDSILSIVRKQDAGINFCIAGLTIGLRHHITPAEIIDKMEQYFDNGGNLDELAVPIIKAVLATGIFGKPEKERKNVKRTE